MQNVLDNVEFMLFFFLQLIGVQPVEKEFDCRINVLCGVVGSVGADGVCEGRFPVNGGFKASRGSVNGYVQIVQGVISLYLCCEVQFGVYDYSIEIVQDRLYVCVGWVKDQQSIIYISEVVYNTVFVC